jgi:hypothetical protein
MHVGGIFFDLAKAFDCVNHEMLLAKLHFYGIQGTAANWFRSCLTNGKQKVEIKPSHATPSFFSNWGAVTHGVPQGSFLDPLLFITYINDLPSTIKTLLSVVISNKSFDDICTLAYSFLSHMNGLLLTN